MGSGIAEACARAGLRVKLVEPYPEVLERSRESIERSLGKAVARGRLEEAEVAEVLGRISHHPELEALTDCPAVVEAVTEDPQVKTRLFAELDATLPEARIIASNTSSIPIAQLAANTQRPERVIGLHFFSPVPVMDLVEIVVAIDTSDESVELAEQLVGRIGKVAIRTKDRSGFIVNMLLVPYLMAAVRMYEEGFASAEDIDQGMRLGCGHPMGPLALSDMIGLDVLYSVCDSLYEEFKRSEYAPPPLLKRLVVSGHLGRKSGKGFYDYSPAKQPVPS